MSSQTIELPADMAREEQEAKEAREALRGGKQPVDAQPNPGEAAPASGVDAAPVDGQPASGASAEAQPGTDIEARIAAEVEKQTAALKHDLQKRAGEYGGRLQDLQRKLSELVVEKAELQRKLFEAASKPPADEAPAPTPAPMGSGVTRYLTEDQRKEIGDDLSAMVALVAKAVAEDVLAGAGIAELPKQVERMSRESGAVRLMDAIDAKAPGFREANGVPGLTAPKDQAWLTYLDETGSPVAGQSLREYLELLPQHPRITTEQIIDTYAAAFTQYVGSKGARATQPSRADDAIPARAKGNTPVPAGAKRTYTESEVTAMTEQLARNPDPQARQKIINELAAATKEGRVIWNK